MLSTSCSIDTDLHRKRSASKETIACYQDMRAHNAKRATAVMHFKLLIKYTMQSVKRFGTRTLVYPRINGNDRTPSFLLLKSEQVTYPSAIRQSVELTFLKYAELYNLV